MVTFTARQKALAIVPKCTGIVSFFCSLYIVQGVFLSKKKRKLTYHRLLLGMSACDMFGSFFGFFLSTWPMPRDRDPPIYAAFGTTETCSMAGFFNHLGNTSTPLYNGSLATYYLLMIVYGWNETRLRKIEWILHAIPLSIGWGTAIAGLALKLYNSANWICWIAPHPPGCLDSYTYGELGNCERGDNSWIYRWAFLYAEVWATILYVAIIMSCVYWSVLKQERAIDRYNLDGERKRTHSRKVANQALLYVGAFLLTWIFGTLTRLLQLTVEQTFYPIILLMAIFFPCQGFFNFLIYLRPRYLRYRQQNPDVKLLSLLHDKLGISASSSGWFRRQSTMNPHVSGERGGELSTSVTAKKTHSKQSKTTSATASSTSANNDTSDVFQDECSRNNKKKKKTPQMTFSQAELEHRQKVISQVEIIERHIEIEES